MYTTIVCAYIYIHSGSVHTHTHTHTHTVGYYSVITNEEIFHS